LIRSNLVALVFAVLLLPCNGAAETCATTVIENLRALGETSEVELPSKLSKLKNVTSVSYLGRGAAYFGGIVYRVTIKDQKKVFKIYHESHQAFHDASLMSKFREDQFLGKNIGFRIPKFVKRDDLGPDIVEVESIQGLPVDKFLSSSLIDKKTKDKVESMYKQKLLEFRAYIENSFKTVIREENDRLSGSLDHPGLPSMMYFKLKPDQIIVTPKLEMYMIDPF
jgi:hypothetical protein